jgi:hypothetical protein
LIALCKDEFPPFCLRFLLPPPEETPVNNGPVFLAAMEEYPGSFKKLLNGKNDWGEEETTLLFIDAGNAVPLPPLIISTLFGATFDLLKIIRFLYIFCE